MKNIEYYKEKLPLYIAKLLSDEEIQDIEKALHAYPELYDELIELNEIKQGIMIHEQVQSTHIPTELLLSYAEDTASLEKAKSDEIKEHLQECSLCSDLLAHTVDSINASEKIQRENTTSIFEKILDILFPKVFVFKPVLVYSATFCLVIASYFVFYDSPPESGFPYKYILETGQNRGGATLNSVIVAENQKIVLLEFIVPTIENEYYNIKIKDNNDRDILTFYHIIHQIPFALELPLSYFKQGDYIIHIMNENDTSEIYQITFTIMYKYS